MNGNLKKRGRPRKNDGSQRCNRLHINLDNRDFEILANAAANCNSTPGKFARQLLSTSLEKLVTGRGYSDAETEKYGLKGENLRDEEVYCEPGEEENCGIEGLIKD